MGKPTAQQTQATQIQVTVSLNPAALEYAKKNARDGDVAGALSSWCTYFVENQSRGALLLEPDQHDFIAELNGGKRFTNGRQLASAVAKGLKREEAQFCFTIKIDPAQVQPLNEQATMMGMTTEEFVNNIVQMIMSNGWLYDFTPELGRQIPFTYQMLKACGELCDKKEVDSSDIAGLIAEDRLLPISRETMERLRELTGKSNFTAADLVNLLENPARLVAA